MANNYEYIPHQNPERERRRALAEAMMQRGLSAQAYGGGAAPIYGKSQQASDLVQTLTGALMNRKLKGEETADRESYNKTLAEALRGPQAPADGMGPVEDKNEYLIKALSGNEQTAPMALRMRMAQMQGTEAPSDIQSFREVQKMNPQDRELFFQTKRGAQIKDIGGVPSVISGREVTPLSTLQREVDAGAMKEGAKTTAKESAEVRVTAGADLGRIEDNAKQTLNLLDKLDKSDLSLIYGAAAWVPVVPGTKQADVYSDWDQLQGKAFLEAFNSLKGGGQITEAEGKKATAAITSLSERKQSPGKAREAIKELRGVIQDGVKRARNKAGAAPAESAGGGLSADEQAEYEELKRRFGR